MRFRMLYISLQDTISKLLSGFFKEDKTRSEFLYYIIIVLYIKNTVHMIINIIYIVYFAFLFLSYCWNYEYLNI